MVHFLDQQGCHILLCREYVENRKFRAVETFCPSPAVYATEEFVFYF